MKLKHILVNASAILLTACASATPFPPTPIPAPTNTMPSPTLTPIPPTATPAEPTAIPDALTYEQAVQLFNYMPAASYEITERSVEEFDGYTVRDILYTAHTATYGAGRGQASAYLVQPEGEGPFAGVLFLHWLGSVNSSRKEFLDEAKLLAQRGVVSLLLDGYFPWGTRPTGAENDRVQVIEQVIELRWALDFLMSQPGVDPARIGYVGHDYGALHGAVLSGIDRRVKAYAFMAGLGNFSNWSLDYFLAPSTDAVEYRKKMAWVEPVFYVPHAAPAVLLFQFAENDNYIPKPVAEEFYNAASEPKEIKWYDTNHKLNEEAQQDRLAWLTLQLGLPDSGN